MGRWIRNQKKQLILNEPINYKKVISETFQKIMCNKGVLILIFSIIAWFNLVFSFKIFFSSSNSLFFALKSLSFLLSNPKSA